jgi:hypothetical protein
MAHELTHIMQQSSDAAGLGLQESVPYGEEEGGLISWFRNWNAKRKFRNARAAAKNNMAPVSNGSASVEDMTQALALGPQYVERSNNAYKASKEAGDSITMQYSRAFQGLGHRETKNDIAKNAIALRKSLMGGRTDAYKAYFQQLDRSGMNYNVLAQGIGGEKKYNENSAFVANDLFDISEKHALSDSGLDYFRLMYNQVKDAEIFKDGGADAMDYVLQTYLTGDTGDMTTALSSGRDVSDEYAGGRQKLLMSGAKNVLAAAAQAHKLRQNGGDIDALGLDPVMRSALERYLQFKNNIVTAMGDQNAETTLQLKKKDTDKRTVRADYLDGRSALIGKIVTQASGEQLQNPELQKLVMDDYNKNMNSRITDKKITDKSSAQAQFRGTEGELANLNVMISRMLPDEFHANVDARMNQGGVEEVMQYVGDYIQNDYNSNENGVARLINQSYGAFNGAELLSDPADQQELVMNNFMLRSVVPEFYNDPDNNPQKLNNGKILMRDVNKPTDKKVKEKRNWLQRIFGRK